MTNNVMASGRAVTADAAEPVVSSVPASIPDTGSLLSHRQALDAICGCASTVTVLSYQEAIEGYLGLRGISHD